MRVSLIPFQNLWYIITKNRKSKSHLYKILQPGLAFPPTATRQLPRSADLCGCIPSLLEVFTIHPPAFKKPVGSDSSKEHPRDVMPTRETTDGWGAKSLRGANLPELADGPKADVRATITTVFKEKEAKKKMSKQMECSNVTGDKDDQKF